MIGDLALDDRQRRQRAKNLALMAVLAALVVLFYVIALVRMGAWQ
ncbi:MAG TPA: hypothetical protein VMU87_03100 [Stellaceae bacterium]|nr:hypothetical protein [Stellaceae bacterium]